MPPGRTPSGAQIRYMPKPPWPGARAGGQESVPPLIPAPPQDVQEDALLLAKEALAAVQRLRTDLVAAGILVNDDS